jgi:hypothetical protein
MEELQEKYDIINYDPFSWIEKAEQHLISANCLVNRLIAIIDHNIDIADEHQMEFIALHNSCLFLCGIAIENAIKGLIISKNPKFQNTNELEKFGWNRFHNISTMLSKNGIVADKAFVSRIQGYLEWAGKYNLPTPNKKVAFPELKQEFYTNDVIRTEEIVNRIVSILESN